MAPFQELHNFVTWQDMRGRQLAAELMNSWSFRSIQTLSGILYKITRNKKYLAGSVVHFKPGMTAINLAWLIKKLKCREQCKTGAVVFGTLDTWLMRKMNEYGHFTEISMAATTALFDPFEIEWSTLFCRLLEIPQRCLPTVIDTDSDKFGQFKEFGLSIRICSDASCSIIGENMINRFGSVLKNKI